MAQQRLAFALLLLAQDREGSSLSLGLVPDLVQAVSMGAPRWRPAPVRGMLRLAGEDTSQSKEQQQQGKVVVEQEEKLRQQTTCSTTPNAGCSRDVVQPNSLAEAPATSVAEGVPPSRAPPPSEGVPPMQT
eukprot:COSAG02_NODE_22534_length_749_cov_1.046154_1_plen_131_part_00